MTLLQWQNLRCLPLIKPCSASVSAGECIVLSGASGSGKSLLWRALAGVDYCECDSLEYLGQSHTDIEPTAWRRVMSYVSQHALFSDTTTLEALKEPFSYHVHRAQSFNLEQMCAWLAVLGKKRTLLEQSVSALSGGERQIIHILRSLQFSPSVILLDEPSAALDDDTAIAFEHLISDWLHAAPQRAVLWISHDSAQAERVATHRWTMHDHQLTTTAPQ